MFGGGTASFGTGGIRGGRGVGARVFLLLRFPMPGVGVGEVMDHWGEGGERVVDGGDAFPEDLGGGKVRGRIGALVLVPASENVGEQVRLGVGGAVEKGEGQRRRR